MLDVNLIRKDPESVKAGIQKKNIDPKLVDKFLRLDEDWRGKAAALDHLQSEQNSLSKELSQHQTKDLLARAALLKKRITEIAEESAKLDKKRLETLENLPNLPFPEVPVGKDAAANVVVREVGKKPVFDFKPRNYLAIGEDLNIINVKKASEVSGSRFGYLLGDAALLEFALVQLAMETAVKNGFLPVVPPVMIRPEVFSGMGRLASSQKEERYFLPKDDLYLVGSAEHTLGPLHMNETLEAETLPRRYVGFSTCFRREAGSYGKDTKGILRVHQFDKVEIFSFANPKDSSNDHEFMLGIQEKIMKALDLPYRVVAISTGDMGWTDAKQYDIETWLPGQNEYRETHSCSNTTDFQSRGINAKYRDKNGEKNYVHLLNATAVAVGRMIIAILENYQTKKGTVTVPDALQSYLGKKEIGK